MATKSAPVNNNHNNNVNNNTHNIHVKVVNQSEKKAVKKESKPNWYTRKIIIAIIAIVVAVLAYFINKNLDAKSAPGTTKIEHTTQAIKGIKQN